MINRYNLDKLVAFRKEFHQYPELSGVESATIARLEAYVNAVTDKAEFHRVGSGLLVVFQGKNPGPTTMIRAELDALPIQEVNHLPYRSKADGKSHKCGHDGHMTMVVGLVYLLTEQPIQKGRVILLFQSAEETGQGACWMLEDPAFAPFRPDYAFALHNLPGHPKHQVLLRKGTFCAASTGVMILLTGKAAHASHPETGVSPAKALAGLTTLLLALPDAHAFDDFVLVSMTHMQLGEATFGVNPSHAEIWLTIRAYQEQDMEKLKTMIHNEVERVARQEQLEHHISYHEGFEATVNDTAQVERLEHVAQREGLDYQYLDLPNRWSEDFGLFLQRCSGAMFGLGSGLDQPALHNPDYDFPDELIETGIKMFWGILQQLNY